MDSHRVRQQVLSGMALVALLACAAPAWSAPPVRIDFEGVAAGDGLGALVTDGFVLDPGLPDWTPDATGFTGHYHITDPADPSWMANNGTQAFVFDFFLDNSRLNIRSEAGTEFALKSLDLGEALLSNFADPGRCPTGIGPLGQPYVISFTGQLSGGLSVTRQESLDMVCDGAGPLADFQTFRFGQEWRQLTSLTIEQLTLRDTPESHVALDNLVLGSSPGTVSPVPEPETYAMWALGLGVILLSARSRRKA